MGDQPAELTLDIRHPLHVCLKHDYAPQLAFALLLPPAESILITLLFFVSAGRGRLAESGLKRTVANRLEVTLPLVQIQHLPPSFLTTEYMEAWLSGDSSGL